MFRLVINSLPHGRAVPRETLQAVLLVQAVAQSSEGLRLSCLPVPARSPFLGSRSRVGGADVWGDGGARFVPQAHALCPGSRGLNLPRLVCLAALPQAAGLAGVRVRLPSWPTLSHRSPTSWQRSWLSGNSGQSSGTRHRARRCGSPCQMPWTGLALGVQVPGLGQGQARLLCQGTLCATPHRGQRSCVLE